ncbi:MAG: ribosome recycling factor [Clostridiales bacterium]|jgi:ribosome recycling factor|nr:ribosome recycling factor [Clostridiales bacterium]
MSNHTKPYEEKMKKSAESLDLELNTIRVGRANPHVLDKVTVSAYGADTPLNQIGNISVPDPRMLVIQPWDSSLLKSIEKAIQASELGINPTNDGKVIRLVFPELTEERRKQLSKDVKKKGEEFKIAIRNIRRDGMDAYKKKQKKSEITEDELKQFEEDMQKLTDKWVAEVEKRLDAKSKEIMSI